MRVADAHLHQDAYQRLAGPKEGVGKGIPVPVVLRCDPEDRSYPPKVRVEARGHRLGHAAADDARVLGPVMRHHSGGEIDAYGMIVGGWRDIPSQNDYGIPRARRRVRGGSVRLAAVVLTVRRGSGAGRRPHGRLRSRRDAAT